MGGGRGEAGWTQVFHFLPLAMLAGHSAKLFGCLPLAGWVFIHLLGWRLLGVVGHSVSRHTHISLPGASGGEAQI